MNFKIFFVVIAFCLAVVAASRNGTLRKSPALKKLPEGEAFGKFKPIKVNRTAPYESILAA